jgi:hypothetical protein
MNETSASQLDLIQATTGLITTEHTIKLYDPALINTEIATGEG